jgi:hypothetical protein
MEDRTNATAVEMWTFGEPVDGRRRPPVAPPAVDWHGPLAMGTMDQHLAGVAPVALSDDAATAVVATRAAIVVLDATTGAELVRIPGALNAFASPDWEHLAVLVDNRLEVRPTRSATTLWSLDLPQEPRAVIWSPDGQRLAIISPGTLRCVDASGRALGRWPRPLRGTAARITGRESWARWLPDSRRIVVLSGWQRGPSGGAVLIDSDDGWELDGVEVTPGHDICVTSLGVTLDGQLLAGSAFGWGGGDYMERSHHGARDAGIRSATAPSSTIWSHDGTRCFVQSGSWKRELREWVEGIGSTSCASAPPGVSFGWLLATSHDGRHVLAEIERHHVGHFRGPDGEPRPEPIVFASPEHFVPGRSTTSFSAWGLIDTVDGSVRGYVGPAGYLAQPPRFSADGHHMHWIHGGLSVVGVSGTVVHLPGREDAAPVDDSAYVATWIEEHGDWLASIASSPARFDVDTSPPSAVQLPVGAPAAAADVAGEHLFVLDDERATMYRLPV